MCYHQRSYMPRIKSGFTILEAMVVIATVGILAAVAIYALNVTRASNRDNKRISDVSVIRAALSQFWLQQATYPASAPVDLGRPGTNSYRLTRDGFVSNDNATTPIYLNSVPRGPKANEFYRYHGSSSGYSLRFKTERKTVYGPPGTWFAHSTGVDQEDTEK